MRDFLALVAWHLHLRGLSFAIVPWGYLRAGRHCAAPAAPEVHHEEYPAGAWLPPTPPYWPPPAHVTLISAAEIAALTDHWGEILATWSLRMRLRIDELVTDAVNPAAIYHRTGVVT